MNRRTIIAAAAAAAVGAGVVVALTGVSDARDEAPVVRRLTVDPQETSGIWTPERTRSAKPRPLPEGP